MDMKAVAPRASWQPTPSAWPDVVTVVALLLARDVKREVLGGHVSSLSALAGLLLGAPAACEGVGILVALLGGEARPRRSAPSVHGAGGMWPTERGEASNVSAR